MHISAASRHAHRDRDQHATPGPKALEALIANHNTSSKVVWRAQIMVAAAEGCGTNEIMRRSGKSKTCDWLERFLNEGVAGLTRDKMRPPGRKPLTPEIKAKVLAKTTTETPPNAIHRSARVMAKAMGLSPTRVQRIWDKAPHLVKRFNVSSDPHFEKKVKDVVGLYMTPPDRALLLCVDEMIQIQALDRTQPGLPLKRGARRR